jgi:CubicO group peptidase (beta-lactamase class C family)
MILPNRSQIPTLGRVFLYTIFLAFVMAPGLLRAQVNASPKEPTAAELQGILELLENFAVAQMNAAGIPGMAYAIIKDDQIIYAKGFGVRKQGEQDPVDENTLFQIGSLTKAFTATLIAMLVDDGKLNWTDRVVQHLPEFEMKERWVTREMQIADILCHRSGMPEYQLDAMAVLGFQRPEIVRATKWVQPVTSFRSAYAYSNTLYLTAGQIIEEKRGHTWVEDLSERLLQPIGMNSSTGDPNDLPIANVATGHRVLSDGSLWPIPEDWRYAGALKTNGPAGSMYSNITDMAQWLRFQLASGKIDGKQLVSTENLAVTRAPRTLEASDLSGVHQSYAMGWVYAALPPLPLLWHTGGYITGMTSTIGFVPGANVGIVVLANAEPVDVPELVMSAFYFLYFNPQASTTVAGNSLDLSATRFLDSASTTLATSARKPLSSMSADQLSHYANANSNTNPDYNRLKLSRYEGSYKNPAYGRFTVDVKDNSLVITMGPAEIKSPLVRYQNNVFVGGLPDFPESELVFKFIVGRGGLVTGLVAPDFNDVNGGLFKKEW